MRFELKDALQQVAPWTSYLMLYSATAVVRFSLMSRSLLEVGETPSVLAHPVGYYSIGTTIVFCNGM